MKILVDFLNPSIARYNSYKTGIYKFDNKEYGLAMICFQKEITYFEKLNENVRQMYLEKGKVHLAEIYTYCAHAQKCLEKFDVARKYYKQATEVYKNYLPALLGLFTVEIEQNTAESAKYYDECIEIYLKNAEILKGKKNYTELTQVHHEILELSNKVIGCIKDFGLKKDPQLGEIKERNFAKLFERLRSTLDILYKEIIVDCLYEKMVEKIDANQDIRRIYDSIAAPIKNSLGSSMQEFGQVLQDNDAKKFFGKAVSCHSQVIKHSKRALGGDCESPKIKDDLVKAYADLSKANLLLKNYAEAANLLEISNKYCAKPKIQNTSKAKPLQKISADLPFEYPDEDKLKEEEEKNIGQTSANNEMIVQKHGSDDSKVLSKAIEPLSEDDFEIIDKDRSKEDDFEIIGKIVYG